MNGLKSIGFNGFIVADTKYQLEGIEFVHLDDDNKDVVVIKIEFKPSPIIYWSRKRGGELYAACFKINRSN